MCFSIQIDKNLKKLATELNAAIDRESFVNLNRVIGLHPEVKMKIPQDNGQVYPHYFAPVIKSSRKQRIIYPMRYRIRPNGSEKEIPSKYNVFNARLDSLMTRVTWNKLLGKNHGVVALKKFYEWVPGDNGKPALISFFPEDNRPLLAPCLYDYWEGEDPASSFFSFAIITNSPTEEIKKMKHDRAPVVIEEKNIDRWLSETNTQAALKLLKEQKEIKYAYQWVTS